MYAKGVFNATEWEEGERGEPGSERAGLPANKEAAPRGAACSDGTLLSVCLSLSLIISYKNPQEELSMVRIIPGTSPEFVQVIVVVLAVPEETTPLTTAVGKSVTQTHKSVPAFL